MMEAPRPEDHLGLVFAEAHAVERMRRVRGFTDPHKDDARNFLSDGFFGLARACRSFDPARGYKFSTYAIPCIRGAIADAIRTESKSKSAHPPEFTTLDDDLVDPGPLPSEQLAQASMREAVRRVVDTPGLLSAQEHHVVVRHYWHDERQAVIARGMGMSRARVGQILQAAHAKLLGPLGRG